MRLKMGKDTVVIYNSQTGFTKRYAQCIESKKG